MNFGVRFKLVRFHFTIRRFSLLNLMAFAWTKIVFALVITYQSHVATFSFRIPSSLSREARLKALKAPEETVFSFYSWKDSNLLMIIRWSFRVRIIKFCFARQTASLRCSCVSQKNVYIQWNVDIIKGQESRNTFAVVISRFVHTFYYNCGVPLCITAVCISRLCVTQTG